MSKIDIDTYEMEELIIEDFFKLVDADKLGVEEAFEYVKGLEKIKFKYNDPRGPIQRKFCTHFFKKKERAQKSEKLSRELPKYWIVSLEEIPLHFITHDFLEELIDVVSKDRNYILVFINSLNKLNLDKSIIPLGKVFNLYEILSKKKEEDILDIFPEEYLTQDLVNTCIEHRFKYDLEIQFKKIPSVFFSDEIEKIIKKYFKKDHLLAVFFRSYEAMIDIKKIIDNIPIKYLTKDIVLEILKLASIHTQFSELKEQIPEEFFYDEDILLEIVKINPARLEFIDKEHLTSSFLNRFIEAIFKKEVNFSMSFVKGMEDREYHKYLEWKEYKRNNED